MTTRDYAKRVHGHFGRQTQLRKMQEECAELIAAIAHCLDGRDNAESELMSEMADVFFLLLQERLDFGCKPFDEMVDYKAARTWQRVLDGKYATVSKL